MIYKRSIFNRGLVWLVRFRYRKGYGVQSPSVFYFINHIIFERTPYYEYERLKRIYQSIKIHERGWILPRKRYELIFRLTNEIKATEVIEIGTRTGLGSIYASAARKSIKCHILNRVPITNGITRKILFGNPYPISEKSGEIETLLSEIVNANAENHIRLILFNSEFFSVTETSQLITHILEKGQSGDCIVFSGLQRSKALRRQWKKCTVHALAGTSYDLYEAGIFFFKPSPASKCYMISY